MSVTVPPQLQGHRAVIEYIHDGEFDAGHRVGMHWILYSSSPQFEVTVVGKIFPQLPCIYVYMKTLKT